MWLLQRKSITLTSVKSIRSTTPLFDAPLHVGEPWSKSSVRFKELLDGVFERRYFSNNGPLVQEFESRIAELHGIAHCICVSSGTLAIQIALKALGVTGEVLVPSFTFIGTAHAIDWIGLKPVFCDIDPIRLTLDPSDVRRKITKNTQCVLPVNVFGRPADFSAFQGISQEYNIPVLYDSAHCTGCIVDGAPIGQYGTAHVLSFHATKSLHTFEGGAVITNDSNLAEKIRSMRNYGYSSLGEVAGPGINAKMSEVCAAHGLSCFEDFNTIVAEGKQNYLMYSECIRSIPGVTMVPNISGLNSNYHYVSILVNPDICGVNRDDIWQVLRENNVLARRYFHPGCHRQKPYKQLLQEPLPVTESITSQILCLPNGESVTGGSIRKICSLIAATCKKKPCYVASL